MSKKKYVPPSRIAARVYKALLLTAFHVEPEYPIGERLEVDFVVKSLGAAIEADGNQHTQYNSFHYNGKDDFRAAKSRDQRKAVLCEQAGLKLVRLSEKEILAAPNPESLLQLILQRISQTQTESEEEW